MFSIFTLVIRPVPTPPDTLLFFLVVPPPPSNSNKPTPKVQLLRLSRNYYVAPSAATPYCREIFSRGQRKRANEVRSGKSPSKFITEFKGRIYVRVHRYRRQGSGRKNGHTIFQLSSGRRTFRKLTVSYVSCYLIIALEL